MLRWSFGLVATLCAGLACASVEGESPPSAALPAPLAPVAPIAPRAATFAAASVPFAKRLTPEQREEWRFLKDAAAGGRFEFDASRLALSRSNDARVRSLAATLVNHHSAAQPRLARMLGARSIAPPMLSNDQRRSLNRLAKLHGTKFDREWMEAVGLRSQQEGVAAYEKAAQSARDPALRAWIEEVLPTLRWQLQAAERAAGGETKYARIVPSPQAVIKAPEAATRYMGGSPAASSHNVADLAEGNMVLGPARPVAVKVNEPAAHIR
jgi:putative membrane protein